MLMSYRSLDFIGLNISVSRLMHLLASGKISFLEFVNSQILNTWPINTVIVTALVLPVSALSAPAFLLDSLPLHNIREIQEH